MRLYFLAMSEAIPIKSYQHGCQAHELNKGMNLKASKKEFMEEFEWRKKKGEMM